MVRTSDLVFEGSRVRFSPGARKFSSPRASMVSPSSKWKCSLEVFSRHPFVCSKIPQLCWRILIGVNWSFTFDLCKVGKRSFCNIQVSFWLRLLSINLVFVQLLSINMQSSPALTATQAADPMPNIANKSYHCVVQDQYSIFSETDSMKEPGNNADQPQRSCVCT